MKTKINEKFQIIVVGGGHAGIEAALSCARRNLKTLLITGSFASIGAMPCNPSIGGPAKGVVVREIDALGGEMGKAADATMLQIKILNLSRGPGVHALRAQIDKIEYKKYMQNVLFNTANLTLYEGYVSKLVVEENKCIGVEVAEEVIYGERVIITTGTYMEAAVMIGHQKHSSGPDGEPFSSGLSKQLEKLGHRLLRLKTGTPPRIKKDSINFAAMQVEPGQELEVSFVNHAPTTMKLASQKLCYLIHTSAQTHQIIKENLKHSAMYGGIVTGIGPRYCPSIEDKITRFADKEAHQLFLEPESVHLDTIYLQGFSTSMPLEIQKKMVNSLEGLEKAVIDKPAYAIEYDAIDSQQLFSTLESKITKHLYFAGQVNGTSGYEEAAGQGLIAGINAGNSLLSLPDFILKRSEAYIGVMINDLITKGVTDPYRLLTSRAEYRLILRNDNAQKRLIEYGYNYSLVSQDIYEQFLMEEDAQKELINFLHRNSFLLADLNQLLVAHDYSPVEQTMSGYEALKRPGITINEIIELLHYEGSINYRILSGVEIHVKYGGYIEKEEQEVKRLKKLENVMIPKNFDYDSVPHLALEARSKLKLVLPNDLLHASSISGVNPSDIGILLRALRKEKYE